jgi:nicotinate phosphoribosyltransferase
MLQRIRCRGDDLLGIYASAIREEIDAMQHLRLQEDEYQWLSGLPFFKADYLQWLRNFRYDPSQVTVINDNGKLNIRMSGPWREVIMWEVPLLAVISELVHRCRSPQVGVQQALLHLETKLADFATRTAELDMSGFRLMDFGTRRRFSRDVQYAIVARLKQEPWFIGTSNYDLHAACRSRQWGPGSRMVPGTSANQPGSGYQSTCRTRRVAGRVPGATRYCPDRLHHHGCLPA